MLENNLDLRLLRYSGTPIATGLDKIENMSDAWGNELAVIAETTHPDKYNAFVRSFIQGYRPMLGEILEEHISPEK